MNRVAEAVFGVGAFVAMVVIFYSILPAEPQAKPRPVVTDCSTQAGLPWDVVVCPDAHAYQITDGRWNDLGRVTPLPAVPHG